MAIQIIRKKAPLASKVMRAAIYYARKRRLARQKPSGSPSEYSQNLYAAGPTHITKNDGIPMAGATKFEFSMWMAPDYVSTNQSFLLSSNNHTYVTLNTNGTIQIKLDSQTSSDLWFFISNETIPANVLTHVYVALDLDADPVVGQLFINGVEVNYAAGTTFTAPNVADGSGLRWSDFDIFSLIDNAFFFSGNFGDFWGDAPATLNGVDAFITPEGDPKDLSELPTPAIWLGGDQTAADILDGQNNGTVTPLVVWAGSTITDV